MKLNRYSLRNFRRLEDVEVDLDNDETIFVGPNNSGKTSSASAFRIFIEQKEKFSIYDFPAILFKKIDDFDFESEEELPQIELDLWFTIDPSVEYGRVANFLPSLSLKHSEIGVRIVYSVDDINDLEDKYSLTYPKGKNQKSLTHFLAQTDNINKYFSLKYFTLERVTNEKKQKSIIQRLIKKDEGRAALKSLLKVDFVEAQRMIGDSDTNRSNRLSSVFSDFYKHNLQQIEYGSEAVSIVDKSNEEFTKHYKKQFKPLMEVISELGFPSANDRSVQVLSTLDPEMVLKGNTTLQYVDNGSGHSLPEAYNGLGFKNLIFIAIQVSHFIKKWIFTEVKRPLCHLVFIEEPEVHLHAQVQRVFVKQITAIAKKIAEESGDENLTPQFLLTTHSSHIIDEVDFTKIRYFKRSASKYEEPAVDKKIASEILNLSSFNEENKDDDNFKFLKKYMKITHCDLFFADAVILVEGAVERLLLPHFIKKTANELERIYYSTLEVGGAYAHIFIPLLEFINVPSLIITDLDSVDSTTKKVCRADQAGAVTSNNTLKNIFGEKTIAEFLALTPKNKQDNQIYTVFQTETSVPSYGEKVFMIPRTLEEAFIYQNMEAVLKNEIETPIKIEKPLDYDRDYKSIYEKVNSKSFKKVDFAMEQLFTDYDWVTPEYIKEGLEWLSAQTVVSQEGSKEGVEYDKAA